MSCTTGILYKYYDSRPDSTRRIVPTLSIGLTSVPTELCGSTLMGRRGFNPSIGLTSVPTHVLALCTADDLKFQSLDRAYKRSDWITDILQVACMKFQSLDRAYKRSD